jgi:hypothetical protein
MNRYPCPFAVHMVTTCGLQASNTSEFTIACPGLNVLYDETGKEARDHHDESQAGRPAWEIIAHILRRRLLKMFAIIAFRSQRAPIQSPTTVSVVLFHVPNGISYGEQLNNDIGFNSH